jgi:uncharacterized membrane protein YphA (DoxX/SURF4 family)
MSKRRVLLYLRLLVGAGFMYQGVVHIQGMVAQADLFAASAAWQSGPLVGGMRPLALTISIAFLEFGMGVFLFGGLLTRILGGLGVILTAFQLVTLGLAGGPLNIMLLVGAAVVGVLGGGGGTMDAALGAMQRKSIENQRIRDEEAAQRRAEKQAAQAERTAQAGRS